MIISTKSDVESSPSSCRFPQCCTRHTLRRSLQSSLHPESDKVIILYGCLAWYERMISVDDLRRWFQCHLPLYWKELSPGINDRLFNFRFVACNFPFWGNSHWFADVNFHFKILTRASIIQSPSAEFSTAFDSWKVWRILISGHFRW